MINTKLKDYLNNLDTTIKPIQNHMGEYDIAKEIKSILDNEIVSGYSISIEDQMENDAFNFLAKYLSEDFGWGTYYGPMMSFVNQDGSINEYPSITKVDKETIDYWTARASESKNPILISRYSDLVIDFSEKQIKLKPDIGLYRKVIDSNIEIANGLLMEELDCITKIERALVLAVRINDSERVLKVKNAIIDLENKVALDDKPGLWGFSLKLLLLDYVDKVSLSDDEENKLVADIKNRLVRVRDSYWLTMSCVSLLSEYYSLKKDENNLKKVLDILKKSIEVLPEQENALAKLHYYEELYSIYQKYVDKGFRSISEDKDNLMKIISNTDLDPSIFKEISVETKISQKDLDDYENAFFVGSNEDVYYINKVISKIIKQFLPKREELIKNFKENQKNFVFQSLVNLTLTSEDGIVIANIDSEDVESRFKTFYNQNIQLGSFFLNLILTRFKNTFTQDSFYEYLSNSELFKNENKEYLKRAIDSYWKNDYIVSSHLFIPIIETLIRELVRMNGGLILKKNNIGGFDMLSMGSFIDSENKNNQTELINRVFAPVYDDISYYFKNVLIDSLGQNLRNDFAHGFSKKKFFSKVVSDTLFHIILCLSIVIKQESKKLE